MSGHSHANNIQRVKNAADKRRAKVFSKLSGLISVAAKKGKDPEKNSELKMAIERAKEVNMPKENIEKAVRRGAGELKDVSLETLLLEAFGPGGVGIIIEAITDNRNRTLNEVRKILEDFDARMSRGGVSWMFEKKGIITVDAGYIPERFQKEDVELLAIEAGAEDIQWQGETIEIYVSPEDTEKVKGSLQEKGLEVKGAKLEWISKEKIKIEDKQIKQKLKSLFEALNNQTEVQDIYSNFIE